MILSILRGMLILLLVAVTALYLLDYQQQSQRIQDSPAVRVEGTRPVNTQPSFPHIALALATTIGIGGLVIAGDTLIKEKKLSAVSGVFLGLLAGLLVAYVLGFVVDLVGVILSPRFSGAERDAFLNLLRGVKVFIGLITCYLGMSLVLQTKDDFRFIIPYIEFSKQVRGERPILMDTSVIIDGRVVDIVQAHFVAGSIIVPRFVLNELQTVADSPDKLRRARGRRGLEVLQKLQQDPLVQVKLDDTDPEGSTVDQKLVALAQELGCRIMTNDYNLSKVCTLRGVEVMNLNELAKALRPVVLPGEGMRVKAVKAGEGPGQAVGYLDDGTMVVIENARQSIGLEVDLVVTSTLQTSAGRMIFGRLAEGSGAFPKIDRPLADGSRLAPAGSAMTPPLGTKVGTAAGMTPAPTVPVATASSAAEVVGPVAVSPTSDTSPIKPASAEPQHPLDDQPPRMTPTVYRPSNTGRNPRRA